MTEPLSDETLSRYAELATSDAIIPVVARKAIGALLGEVERLKARESDLIADIEMFGGAMRALVLGELGEDVRTAEGIADVIRTSVRKTAAEREALERENATLRRELDAATAALATHGQASFLAGMRTKGMEGGDDPA